MQGSNIHIISRSWKSGSAWFLPGKTWSVNYKLNWEVAVWGCADTSDFEIWGANKFLRKVLLTKPKLHENIPICSWEVNNFHLGVNIPIPYLYRNNTHYVKSVRIRSYSDPHFSSIFPHSDWIREYVGKYADQNNLEYGHFLRSGKKWFGWKVSQKVFFGSFSITLHKKWRFLLKVH